MAYSATAMALCAGPWITLTPCSVCAFRSIFSHTSARREDVAELRRGLKHLARDGKQMPLRMTSARPSDAPAPPVHRQPPRLHPARDDIRSSSHFRHVPVKRIIRRDPRCGPDRLIEDRGREKKISNCDCFHNALLPSLFSQSKDRRIDFCTRDISAGRGTRQALRYPPCRRSVQSGADPYTGVPASRRRAFPCRCVQAGSRWRQFCKAMSARAAYAVRGAVERRDERLMMRPFLPLLRIRRRCAAHPNAQLMRITHDVPHR